MNIIMEEGFKEIDYKADLDEREEVNEIEHWNHCGGAILVGCWFGIFLLPLVHYSNRRTQNKAILKDI